MSAHRHPPLSVVIPTHNRCDTIADCVDSVIAATPPDTEVIVSDDGSGDRTAQVVGSLQEAEARVRLVSGPQGGPAVARNRGWRTARANLIAFIDDDCRAEPGWGERIVAPLKADPSVTAVEGQTDPAREPRAWFEHSIRSRPRAYLSCNLAVRRAALAEIGGFDEAFPFAHGEDLDLCYRLLERGGRIVHEPAALAIHDVVDVDLWFHLRRVRYDPSTYRLFVKHPSRFAEAAAVAKLPVWPAPAPGKHPGFAQIFAYTAAHRLAQGYLSLRDGDTLVERIGGPLIAASMVMASLRYLPSDLQTYRAATARPREG